MAKGIKDSFTTYAIITFRPKALAVSLGIRELGFRVDDMFHREGKSICIHLPIKVQRLTYSRLHTYFYLKM